MDVFRFLASNLNQPVLSTPVPGCGFARRPLGAVELFRSLFGQCEGRFGACRNLLVLRFKLLAGALEICFPPLSGFKLRTGIARFERELREAPLRFRLLYLERFGFTAGACFRVGSLLTLVVGLRHLEFKTVDPSLQFPDLSTARQERQPRILRRPEGHRGIRHDVACGRHEKVPCRNLLALAKR